MKIDTKMRRSVWLIAIRCGVLMGSVDIPQPKQKRNLNLCGVGKKRRTKKKPRA